MQVLKIGGNELEVPSFRHALAQTVAALAEPVVVVHGGGKAIADMQSRLGLRPVMVDGLRVTDGPSLQIAQMVLSGYSNKLLVTALLAAGVEAIGISGVDGGLLRCVKRQHPAVDLGYVGQVVAVEDRILRYLLQQGMTPVVSPVSLGLDGQVYNVNADEAAGTIATSLAAETLYFVSNVPGVLDGAGRPIPTLSTAETEALLNEGVIHGGMVPKVQAALDVIARGVPQARIVNLDGLQGTGGTVFSNLATE